MRYLFIVIALVVAVAAALFMVPIKGGSPVLDWAEFKRCLNDAEFCSVFQSDPSKRELYRWRDARGYWQYGNVPPPGVEAEVVTLSEMETLSPDAVRQGKWADDKSLLPEQ